MRPCRAIFRSAGVSVAAVAATALVALAEDDSPAGPAPSPAPAPPPAPAASPAEPAARPDATTAFTVTVTGPDGAPVPDAEVIALGGGSDLDASNSRLSDTFELLVPPRPRATARTDAAGQASIAGLDTGRFRLVARAPGFGATIAETSWARGPVARDVRITLPKGHTLTGRVRAGDGARLEGFEVIALPAGPPRDRPVARAAPAADGTFRLDDLAPGTWNLRTRSPASGWATSELVLIPGVTAFDPLVVRGGTVRGRVRDARTRAAIRGARVEISRSAEDGPWGPASAETRGDGSFELRAWAESRDVDAVSVTASGWASYAARVAWSLSEDSLRNFDVDLVPEARIGGTVTDAAGPVAGARVSVRLASAFRDSVLAGDRITFSIRYETTDASGRWTVNGLADGPVSVGVSAAGRIAARSRTDDAPVAELCARGVEVVLRPGTETRLDFEMIPDPAPPPVRQEFAGVVLLPDGRPAAWADVVLGHGRSDPSGRSEVVRSVADANGRFRIRGEGEPGAFTLTARLRGGAGQAPLASPPIPAESGAENVVGLARGHVARGVVVSRSGLPVAGAVVWLGSRARVRDPGAGPGGNPTRWASDAGQVGQDGTFEVAVAAIREMDLPGLVVAVVAAGHATAVSAPFTREDLAAGHILKFVLDAGVTLAGRVVQDEDGTPVAGATISVFPSDEGIPPEEFPERGPPEVPNCVRAVTGADGSWSVPCLTPEDWSVVVRAPGACDESVEVRLPPPPDARSSAPRTSPAPVEVRLVRTTEIAGRVVAANGTPAADVRVFLKSVAAPRKPRAPAARGVPADGRHADQPDADPSRRRQRVRIASVVSNPDGSFRFRGVRPGAWVLTPSHGATPPIVVQAGDTRVRITLESARR